MVADLFTQLRFSCVVILNISFVEVSGLYNVYLNHQLKRFPLKNKLLSVFLLNKVFIYSFFKRTTKFDIIKYKIL